MSKEQVERFSKDLASDPALQAEAKAVATSLSSVVAFGKKKGYDFTLDEAKAYIQAHVPRKLNDAELNAVALGARGVTAANTNVVANAEAVANAVAVTNGAAAENVAAAAEVVVAAVIVLI